MKLLPELKHYLATLGTDLRRRLDWSGANEIAGATAIVEDIERDHVAAARHAFAAEQADLEACRLIRESLADGKVTANEIPVLRTALRHVTNSARHDRAITQIV